MTEILLNTLEDERRYVARELHDGVAQTSLQLGLQVGICQKLLERGNLDMLATELAQLEERTQMASSQVREIIADMRRPQTETNADLDDYIQCAVDTHLERGGPPVEYQCDFSKFPPCSTHQKLALYRVVQEALLNIRKHAQAKVVQLSIVDDTEEVSFVIADNGAGFADEEVAVRPLDKGGAGLANLKVRAQSIGGRVTVGKNLAGEGTEIKITLPKP